MVNRQKQIRKLLSECPKGLTAQQIADLTDKNVRTTYLRLKAMPDTYIVGWTDGRPRALWTVVVPPEDCPRPEKKMKTLKEYARQDMKRKTNAASL
jgi:hypothetical protein